jgi:processive 1,2-diacylglycerol beta-glucosyltransferase
MKILVIHVSAGAGHTRAAQAIYRGLQNDPERPAVIIDALDYTSPWFKTVYRKTYAWMVRRAPAVWAGAFAFLDIPFLQRPVGLLRRLYNHANGRALEKFLIAENFDYVVSTHFLPTEVAAALRRAGKISSKLITVVTDYDVHHIWLARGVYRYCVASEWTREKIARMGVPKEDVVVTGIPIDDRFTAPQDIGELKARLGLDRDKFTVLLATGSFGFGPMEKIASAMPGDFQVIVVCGHNRVLRDRLRAQARPHIIPLGLVDNMHELMAVSDAMVTKPGGLSITEAINSQLPMIFFSPIPGQETRNIRILGQYGIGKAGLSVRDMIRELENLRQSKDYYRTLLRRVRSLARPGAVRDIISLLV